MHDQTKGPDAGGTARGAGHFSRQEQKPNTTQRLPQAAHKPKTYRRLRRLLGENDRVAVRGADPREPVIIVALDNDERGVP